jgi:hypothetical protein
VWITSAPIIFFDQYIADHAQEAAMMKSMPSPDSPRSMMALVGPVIGVVFGLVLGVFAFVAGKFVKPATLSPLSVFLLVRDPKQEDENHD